MPERIVGLRVIVFYCVLFKKNVVQSKKTGSLFGSLHLQMLYEFCYEETKHRTQVQCSAASSGNLIYTA